MIREVMISNGWKMFRHYSQEEVEHICSEIGIPTMTLKIWISKLRRELRINNEAAGN
ncbi:hypothetical protein PHJA_002067300 [Phtheirospermum japonicum]|uniref:Uncharacterized protein n=1 Tax=Phtheirospermum japonicum TaxID=374723 RepID=A0A830CSX2_9LAMI|nr:hypothetical protein PHJA_002067300 [Phtheirospermum japonicum]